MTIRQTLWRLFVFGLKKGFNKHVLIDKPQLRRYDNIVNIEKVEILDEICIAISSKED
jgi:hypothetical protein